MVEFKYLSGNSSPTCSAEQGRSLLAQRRIKKLMQTFEQNQEEILADDDWVGNHREDIGEA